MPRFSLPEHAEMGSAVAQNTEAEAIKHDDDDDDDLCPLAQSSLQLNWIFQPVCASFIAIPRKTFPTADRLAEVKNRALKVSPSVDRFSR